MFVPMVSHSGPDAPDHYAGYRLVWRDEFNEGTRPNPSDWTYELGFVRNHEPQSYRYGNVSVKDGCLILEGRKETVPNLDYDAAAPRSDWKHSWDHADYTSGSIKTAGKHVWTYGRFECRGKIGIGSGLWPAFWMTGPTRQWPANGEVDIMEFYRDLYHANAAWGSAKPGVAIWNSTAKPIEDLAHESGYPSAEAWSQDFHVYRMDWDPNWISLYVDGHLLNKIDLGKTINQSPDGKNPFHEPHHILLNLAIGSTGGDPSNLQFPVQFRVDWVRVFQRE